MARKAGAGAGSNAAIHNALAMSSEPLQTTRTTLVLPVTLDQNLEIYAVRTGLPKGEIIKRVLVDFLKKEGMQPDKRPRMVEVAY